ncbi:MAG: hypothetical protein MJ222_02540 [Bacilli bacterium]|nr:hypothetical protein [Bacilli bacterium]
MNEVISIIKYLLHGYKTNYGKEEKVLISEVDNKKYFLWNCDYLLNQVIRHYNIPQERYYYSKEAKELWISLGFELKDLKTKYYREQINPLKDNVRCLLFSGSSNKPYKESVSSSDAFPFKDAFHLEHIVPIAKIIEELVELVEPNDADIEKVLDKLCVARITKVEDRKLHNKSKRDKTFELVYNNLYKKNGIILYNNVTDEEVM